MAKKPQPKGVDEKVHVTMLNEVRLDEYSLVLRSGEQVRLARAMLDDPRVAGNFKEKG